MLRQATMGPALGAAPLTAGGCTARSQLVVYAPRPSRPTGTPWQSARGRGAESTDGPDISITAGAASVATANPPAVRYRRRDCPRKAIITPIHLIKPDR